MKFSIELERTVELIVEAPNEEAAKKAAQLYMDDDLMWWDATEDAFVYEYEGPNAADCTVDENGQDVYAPREG
jgi:hypothetical protein